MFWFAFGFFAAVAAAVLVVGAVGYFLYQIPPVRGLLEGIYEMFTNKWGG